MDTHIGKRYKLKSSKNFEEYLKFIDVGYLARMAASAVVPVTFTTKHDDGSYTINITTSLQTVNIGPFKLGAEFEEKRPDGTIVKSAVVYKDNKIIHTQVESNGRKSVHTREFTDTNLTVISTVDGWDLKCVRVYDILD